MWRVINGRTSVYAVTATPEKFKFRDGKLPATFALFYQSSNWSIKLSL